MRENAREISHFGFNGIIVYFFNIQLLSKNKQISSKIISIYVELFIDIL